MSRTEAKSVINLAFSGRYRGVHWCFKCGDRLCYCKHWFLPGKKPLKVVSFDRRARLVPWPV